MRHEIHQLTFLARLVLNRSGSTSAIEKLRSSRLERLLRSASAHVPYYRESFPKGPTITEESDARSILARIPVSRKVDLKQRATRELLDSRWSAAKLRTYTTTGSTGVPFTIFKSPVEDLVALFLRLRVARSFGLRRGITVLRLSTGEKRAFLWKVASRLGSLRNVDIQLTDAPAEIAATIRRTQPNVIMGNAGVLTRVALELSEDGPLEWNPDFVVSSAEVLTPAMRDLLGGVFGCPVFNSYNCVEVMHPVAWECRTTGLFHVCDDALILEVLRDGRPVAEGDEGEVVITSLVSCAMPIIRWSQGDLAELGPNPCPCGSPYSTLRRIAGRMTDYLQLPDGRQLFASALAYVLHRRADWILQYQITQETLSSILLRASALRQPSDAELTLLRTELEARVGPGVSVRIELVRRLEPEKHGKFRVLLTRMGSPYET
jgi:phenylacetate-CoA ligase